MSKQELAEYVLETALVSNSTIVKLQELLSPIGYRVAVLPDDQQSAESMTKAAEVAATKTMESMRTSGDLFSLYDPAETVIVDEWKAASPVSRRRRRWTPREIQKLQEMIDQGKTYAQMAQVLNRTEKSIKHKALETDRMASNSGESWTANQISLLAKSLDDGLNYAEIGKILKRTTGAISGRVHLQRMQGDPRFTKEIDNGKN